MRRLVGRAWAVYETALDRLRVDDALTWFENHPTEATAASIAVFSTSLFGELLTGWNLVPMWLLAIPAFLALGSSRGWTLVGQLALAVVVGAVGVVYAAPTVASPAYPGAPGVTPGYALANLQFAGGVAVFGGALTHLAFSGSAALYWRAFWVYDWYTESGVTA